MERTLVRAGLYRYFAAVFRYPDEIEWSFINDVAAEARAELGEFGMKTGAFDELVEALSRQRREEIESEYVATFLNGLPSVIAPPYESMYCAEDKRLSILAAVNETYERCGVGMSDEVADMPDHIATELEFMQYLCVEESAKPEHAEVIAASAHEFLRLHLAPFTEALSGQLTEGMYHYAAKALAGFVAKDLASVVVTDTAGMALREPETAGGSHVLFSDCAESGSDA